MDISEHIAELLEDHDYVILPGAGAFMAAYRPARPDSDSDSDSDSAKGSGIESRSGNGDGSGSIRGSGLLLPPSREITFQPSMKMDDGVLTGYLMRQMGQTHQEARKRVTDYADDLLYRLHQEGQVCLDHLGTLTLQEGVMGFTPLEALERLPDAYGLAPVAYGPPPVDPVGVIPAGKPSADTPDPVKLEHATLPERRFRRKTLMLLLPAMGVVAAALLFWIFYFRGGSSPESSTRNSRQEVSPTGNEITSPSTSREVGATPGTLTMGDQNDTADAITRQIAADLDSTGKGRSGVGKGSDGKALSAPPKTAAGASATAQRPYYLVAGSFRSEKNAGDFMQKLIREGYQPVNLGQVGSYFIVATDSFMTEREAVRAANRYNEQHPGSEAWIYPSRR